MKIYTIEINGEEVEYVEIELAPNHFTSMTKARWDELEAQKELGGTL